MWGLHRPGAGKPNTSERRVPRRPPRRERGSQSKPWRGQQRQKPKLIAFSLLAAVRSSTRVSHFLILRPPARLFNASSSVLTALLACFRQTAGDNYFSLYLASLLGYFIKSDVLRWILEVGTLDESWNRTWFYFYFLKASSSNQGKSFKFCIFQIRNIWKKSDTFLGWCVSTGKMIFFGHLAIHVGVLAFESRLYLFEMPRKFLTCLKRWTRKIQIIKIITLSMLGSFSKKVHTTRLTYW